MHFRKLRIAWSVAWGVVAVLLCVLWVQSHYSHTTVAGSGTGTFYLLRSERGLVMVKGTPGLLAFVKVADWNVVSDRDVVLTGQRWRPAYRRFPTGSEIFISTWMLVLMCGTLTAAPWLSLRFSLRTLLIATPLVAMGLGLIVWSSQR